MNMIFIYDVVINLLLVLVLLSVVHCQKGNDHGSMTCLI